MALVRNETNHAITLDPGPSIGPGETANVDLALELNADLLAEGRIRVTDGAVSPPAPDGKRATVRAIVQAAAASDEFVIDVSDANPVAPVPLGTDGLPWDASTLASDTELAAAVAAVGGRFRGAYASGTAYKAKDLVTQAGSLYSRNADGTPSGAFVGGEWTQVTAGSSGAVIKAWATGTDYKQGQPVTANGRTYTAVDDHTAGATFAGDLSAHWVPLPNRGIYDPLDYGAKYDGSTDDTAAIQAAIDACTTAGGGVVEIRAVGGLNTVSKRVKISSDVVVKDGVWFRGLGPTTTFMGAGCIRIPGSGIVLADRITISDFTMQSPSGVGVKLDNLGGTGGLQLGWPRITVQNVTVVDPTSYGFQINVGIVIECRLINCVVMRGTTTSFEIGGTDNFLIGCTAGGASSGGGSPGIRIGGGNNHIIGCKSYGQTGDGFALAGAGRHMLSGCEAQDNGIGYRIYSGSNNTLAACLSDSSKIGFRLDSGAGSNTIQGVAMAGGGGSGNPINVGLFLDQNARNNIIDLTTTGTAKLGGDLAGNSIRINGEAGTQTATYAATFTPDPFAGSLIKIPLTGNISVKSPVGSRPGQRMTLAFQQDSTGGRTITFDSGYRTTSAWNPALTGSTVDRIDFVFDGTRWVQNGAALGLTVRTGITDSFTYSNGAMPAPWTTSDSKLVISSNKVVAPTAGPFTLTSHAWRDAGTPDATVQATMLDGNTFLTFRVVDASNYLYWADNALGKVVAGVSSSLAVSGTAGGAGVSISANDVLKVVAVGDTFLCYKNGNLVLVVSDATHHTATKFGIGIGHPSSLGVDDFTLDGDSAAASTNPAPSGGSSSAAPSIVLPKVLHSGRYTGLPSGGSLSVSGPGQDTLDLFPFMVKSAVTLDRIGAEVTGASAGSVGRLGIYNDDGTGYPGTLLGDYGTIDASTTGAREITISQALQPGVLYWAGCVAQVANAVFRALQSPSWAPLSGSSITDVMSARACWRQTGVTGALPSTFTSTKTAGGNLAVLVGVRAA